MPRTGRDALLEVLRTEGVRHLFGNPGSTELPLMDALATAEDLHYVLALQEATAVGMADGYAQATGRPAFVNLHTSAGLGNAIGNLTNAQANQTPLVVTAGQQDERHLVADPLLAGDLVGLARPVSKWAHEVRGLGELGVMLRRAFHDAAAPPPGPVFVSLRMSTLDAEGEAPVPPASTIDRRSTAAGLDELARLLTEPAVGKLAIVVGRRGRARPAPSPRSLELAEALGAPVYASPLHSTGVFPPAHPLWAGMLPPAATGIRAIAVRVRAGVPDRRPGLHGVPVHRRLALARWHRAGAALPRPGDARPHLLRAASAWWAIPGSPSTRWCRWCGPRPTRSAAADAAGRRPGPDAPPRRDALEETALGRYEAAAPMDPDGRGPRARAGDAIRLPSSSTRPSPPACYVRGFHHWTEPGRYFFCKGGGLGWGMPAALGVSLAHGGTCPCCASWATAQRCTPRRRCGPPPTSSCRWCSRS